MTPLSAMAEANAWELSSTFQPEMFTGVEPVLVSSNQSEPTGLFATVLDQGETSEMMMLGGAAVMLNVKLVLASGVFPTVVSSTVTVTL